MEHPQLDRVYWSSSTAFVVAAAGAVIGLGNIRQLPYLVGEYGGGAFLIVYCAALAVMALPLLIAQLILGRGARSDLPAMFRDWALAACLSRAWTGLGYLLLAAAVAVLSYYCVIAGWSLAFLARAAGGSLSGLDAEALRAQFLGLVSDPEKVLGWQTLFLLAAGVCVARGVRRGLETSMGWLLSSAALILIVLLVQVCVNPGAAMAAERFFRPDFAALGWRGVMAALQQAFFSLSLGLGVMLAFGTYLRHNVSLWRAGTSVVVLDTAFAITAGYVVTALLAAGEAEPTSDLRLVFEVLPAAAGGQLGGWFGVLFFALIFVLSLTSAIALLEPVVVWIRARAGVTRVFATLSAGTLVWLLGLGTVLSFNLLAGAQLYERTFFGWLSLSASYLLLPALGLLVCIFVGRFLPSRALAAHWAGGPGWAFSLWRWLLRYPARAGMVLVLLYCLGVFDVADVLW